MSVQDLLAQEDEAAGYKHTFYLWPRLWAEYSDSHNWNFDWHFCQFNETQIDNIPTEPGIYTFVVQPSLANHPSSSYLMYVGKTARTLRDRFKDYLRERTREIGRPRVVRLLNKYPDNLLFCYTVVPDLTQLGNIEDALMTAFVPPCNDQLPARVRAIMEALR